MATTRYPISTMAKVLNLTERRVQQLARDGIIPKPEKGKYDLIPCVIAYIKYLQERSVGKDAAPQDTHLQRARLLKAQAEKTELELATMRGNQVTVEQVEKDWMSMVTTVRSKLLAMPSKLAFQVITFDKPHEAETCIKRAVYETLTELADPNSYEGIDLLSEDEIDDDFGLDSATGADGEPVGGSVSETESGSE